MALSVREIMNRELLAVVMETPMPAVRELLRTFGVGAVPVLDDQRRPVGLVTAALALDRDGTAGECVIRPPTCVEGSTGIDEAALRMARADAHQLIVVDSAGVAVGIVSALDALRAMLGVATHHPASFPHWDAATHTSWTDEWPLDARHVSRAPDAPGVLVLVRGLAGETDAAVWVEACANVRARLVALTALVSSAEPALARILERRDLRFRAATVHADADRERLAASLRSDLEHRPPPGGT